MTVPGLPSPGRTIVVGVLNVTPDSFSDGGRYVDPAAAVRHGLDLVAEGADIVDVGGESTRPGAARIDADVEAARVLPVIRALAAEDVVLSIDTTRAAVAEAAVDAGARLVNDVSGGTADPAMAKTVAALGTAYILMHGRGPSSVMQQQATYSDVVAEVRAELAHRLDVLVDAGLDVNRVVVDPGVGFAKTAEHNWRLLADLDVIGGLGRPVLVGASRKSFLGAVLAADEPRPVDDRDDATTALTAVLAWRELWGVRVHAVRASADAVRVVAEIRAAASSARGRIR